MTIGEAIDQTDIMCPVADCDGGPYARKRPQGLASHLRQTHKLSGDECRDLVAKAFVNAAREAISARAPQDGDDDAVEVPHDPTTTIRLTDGTRMEIGPVTVFDFAQGTVTPSALTPSCPIDVNGEWVDADDAAVQMAEQIEPAGHGILLELDPEDRELIDAWTFLHSTDPLSWVADLVREQTEGMAEDPDVQMILEVRRRRETGQ